MVAAAIELQTDRWNGEGIRIPASAHTLEGFCAWATSDEFPKHGHFAFLAGNLYVDTSMEELETHNKILIETLRVVANINKKEDRGQLLGDRFLLTNRQVQISTEPDAFLVTWESLERGLARLVRKKSDEDRFWQLDGRPDWIMEIVSKTSVNKDSRVLRELYHQAGIPEYWLIDARGEDVDFQILLWGKKGYRPAVRSAGWQRSKVFGHSFRFSRRRGRMGLWQYTLHVKK